MSMIFLSCISPKDNAMNYTVTLYKNGEKLKILDKSSQLVAFVESLMIKSDDIYELIVTDELINQLKTNDSALEIIYNRKKQFTINKTETIKIKSILVPLSGKFTDNNDVVFFCGFPEYSSGPYIKKGAIEPLLQEINDLEWK